ncbi:hypothetical protein Glove_24g51 [Diversispora epigaea]|uniref:TLDc domain-containing protein n=1 Tax=Diversispora epigaea TaxID=1348612 RepID=A0A397JTP0_9GLOM|nr:hypothetical protein Glove_24g51 [Diversispora epigaea]
MGKTNDSFIFSLKNGNIQNSILSRVKNRDKAIFNLGKVNQVYFGPYFGEVFYMYSYFSNFMLGDCCVCDTDDHDYYEKPITTTDYFSIVDYEVFKIIKKSS